MLNESDVLVAPGGRRRIAASAAFASERPSGEYFAIAAARCAPVIGRMTCYGDGGAT